MEGNKDKKITAADYEWKQEIGGIYFGKSYLRKFNLVNKKGRLFKKRFKAHLEMLNRKCKQLEESIKKHNEKK
jgi:hypothetical protein